MLPTAFMPSRLSPLSDERLEDLMRLADSGDATAREHLFASLYEELIGSRAVSFGARVRR